MENFQYYTPTKVVFGKGAEEQAGKLIRQQGCGRVLIRQFSYDSGRNDSGPDPFKQSSSYEREERNFGLCD